LRKAIQKTKKEGVNSIKMDLRRMCCEEDGTNLVGIMSSNGLWLDPLCSNRILVSSAYYRYKKQSQKFYIHPHKFYLIASYDVPFTHVRYSVRSLVGASFPD
jgi:hypothetical protein